MVERIGNEEGVEFGGREPGADTVLMAQADTGATGQPAAQTDVAAVESRVVVEVEQGGILRLPANASIDRPQVNGSDLEFVQADGTIIVVPDGAVQGLTIFIGNVEIPPVAVAALFEANGIETAAGPGAAGARSSGGNFEVPVGGIGDAFDIGDLLPPTELAFSGPEFRELYPANNRPSFRLADFDIRLSEEGLLGGLADGLPLDLDTTDNNYFVIDLGASDPDGDPLTFKLGLPNVALTSGGQPVVWTGVGTNHLIGKVGNETVIDITVGGKTGIVLIQLLKPIDHPDGSMEDVITMGVRVTVSDGRGGTASAMLNIGIEDDSPIASNVVASPLLQDEAHNVGNDEDGKNNVAGGGSGSLFKAGADGFKALDLIGPEMKVIPVGSDGVAGAPVAVVWTQSMVGGNVVLTGTADGFAQPVAVLTVRPDGSYTYVQNAPVASSVAAHDGAEETDDFTFSFTVTDGDNDSDSGSLTIRINDDKPVVTQTNVVLTVAENDIFNLRSQGSDPFNQETGTQSTSQLAILGGGFASTVSGSLASTVSFGADGRGGFEFTANAIDTLNALGLTSKGGTVVFTLVGDAVIGYVNGAFNGFQPAIDRAVMSLELDADGKFTFRLYDQLDHVADVNTEGTILKGAAEGGLPHIDFGSVIRAYDGDGDSVTLGGKLRIVVKDDIPAVNTNHVVYGVVEEEHVSSTMPHGNEDTTANPDLDQDTAENPNWTTNVVSGSGINSLAALITNGADEGGKFSFKSDIDPNQMSNLTSGRQPVVLSVVDHGNGSQTLVGKAGGVDVFQLTVNANGSWKFTLLAQLDHHSLADADNAEGLLQINFGEFLQYTDYDGDTVGLDGAKFLIKVIDDIPVIKSLELSGNVVQHDETPKIQKNSEDNDVKYSTLPDVVRSAFAGVKNPGDDRDVDSDDKDGPRGSKAIGFAASQGAVVTVDASYGADQNGKTTYALALSANGVSSGLFTTEGREIFLFKESGVIVGRYDVNGGTVTQRDPAAFAITVGPNGELYLAQWVSLRHDSSGNDHDDYVSIIDDVLQIDVTVTDGDGDSVKGTINIGAAVRFDDDGPSVKVEGAKSGRHEVTLDKLVLDETIGRTSGDNNAHNDDVRGVTEPTLMKEADPTKAIGILATPSGHHGTSVSDLFKVSIDAGADGQKSVVESYSFVLRGSDGMPVAAGSNSGVATHLKATAIAGLTGDTRIFLFHEADGTIVGRTADGFVALRIVIAESGNQPKLVVEQYLPIDHGNDGNRFDSADLLEFVSGKAALDLKLTVTVTDRDNDTATDSHTVALIDKHGSFVKFEDDGPALDKFRINSEAQIVHDETPGLQGNDTDSVAPGLFSSIAAAAMGHAFVNGTSLFSISASFGSDGPQGSTGYTFKLSVGQSATSLKTVDGDWIKLFLEGDLVVGRVGGQSGKAAFAIHIDAETGNVTLAQYLPLQHRTGNDHDDVRFLDANNVKVTLTLTDGDGDHVTSRPVSIGDKIGFRDDGPDAVVDNEVALPVLTVDESNGLGSGQDGQLVASESFADNFGAVVDYGADGAGSVAYALELNGANVGSGLYAVDPSAADGKGAEIVLNQSGGVITGSVGGVDYFTITVDAAGKVTFALNSNAPVWHANTGDHDDASALQVAAGKLLLTQTVTDADGDWDNASIDIGTAGIFKIEDDGPTVVSVTTDTLGDDLILNGSFEVIRDGTGEAAGDVPGGWQMYREIPDWLSANGIPFEIQRDGAGGQSAQDGRNLVELDSDLEGNGAGDRNNGGSTNATIWQEIATEVGQTYSLTFHYAPRPGSSGNGMIVSANGDPIYTLESDPASGWTSKTVTFTATSTLTKIAFTGTGNADEFGILLDNVSLRAVLNGLDDDSQDNGVQGGPGDDANGKVASGKINFDAGTDGLSAIAFDPAQVTVTDAKGATSSVLKAIFVDIHGLGHVQNVTMTWEPSAPGGMLIGKMSYDGETRTVFTATLDAAGDYVLTMYAPLAHPFTDPDFNNDGSETEYEDNLVLNLGFTITDGDGDTVSGALHFSVDDDTPDFVNGGVENTSVVTFGEIVSGNLNIEFGADGQHAENGIKISGWHDLEGVTETLSEDGRTLTAIREIGGEPVYTLSISEDGKSYSFVQHSLLPGGPSVALPAVPTTGGFGPVSVKNFGNFAVEGISGDINGSGQGFGVGNNLIEDNEKLAIVFGNAMTSVVLGVGSVGNGTMHIDWVAKDGDGNIVASGTTANFNSDTALTITPIAAFVRIELTADWVSGPNANAAHFRINSVGGTMTTPLAIDALGFEVTATDGDGDSDQSSFLVSLKQNAAPTVTIDADGIGDSVNESGLVGGSTAGTGHTATGSFTVADADGLDSITAVTIDGAGTGSVTEPLASLVGKTIAGAHGEIKITGVSGGVVSYIYTLTNPTTDAADAVETDVFSITVSDGQATSAPATITIEIIDDVPTAVDDVHAISEKDAAAIEGQVLDNDSSGADSPKTFVGWNGSTTAVYGTFTANGDGTYKYVLNTLDSRVSGLDAGESLTEIFSYTMKDSDGDERTAQVIIKINGVNDTPVVTINANGIDDSVNESGLPGGSTEGSGHTATGSFTLSDPDGLADLKTVTINDETVDIDDLAGATFNTPLGTLKIDTYDQASGVATYTYTLTKVTTDVDGVDEADSFNLTVSDGTVSSAPATITIKIVDDVPVAHDIVAGALTEDVPGSVGGNVKTDAGNSFGADGEAAANAVSWGTVIAKLGGTDVVLSDYGTLTRNADGSWSFVLDNSSAKTQALDDGETIKVSFAYTLTDKDADTATKTVSFTINGVDDTATVVVPPSEDAAANGAAGLVYEKGLTSADDTSEIETGSFSVTASDGIATVTIGTQSHDLANWADETIDTVEGTLKITGVNSASDGKSATFTYEYTLKAAQTHDKATHDTSIVDTVGVTVTGLGGSTAHGDITITIVDDVPTATDNAHTVQAGSVLTVDVQLVVDMSGSMGPETASGWNGGSVWAGIAADAIPGSPAYGVTRIGLARYSLDKFLNENPEIQNVQIVRFATSADTAATWMSRDDAIAFVRTDANWTIATSSNQNPLGFGSATHYNSAILGAMDKFVDNRAHPSDKTFIYFITDGNPTSGQGLTGDLLNQWNAFVSNPAHHIDDVYGVGIGSLVNASSVLPVVGGDSSDVVIVSQSNPNELSNTLGNLLAPSSAQGNVLINDVGSATGADSFGADGGHIKSIEIDGKTYSFDPNGTPKITASGTGSGGHQLVEAGGTWIKVVTDVGGMLTFHFADSSSGSAGTWNYLAPNNVTPSGKTENFHYTIIDGDGDTDSANLTITVLPPPVPPSAVDVVTEAVAGAVLATDPDSDPQDLVYELVGSGVGANGTLTLNPDGNYSYSGTPEATYSLTTSNVNMPGTAGTHESIRFTIISAPNGQPNSNASLTFSWGGSSVTVAKANSGNGINELELAILSNTVLIGPAGLFNLQRTGDTFTLTWKNAGNQPDVSVSVGSAVTISPVTITQGQNGSPGSSHTVHSVAFDSAAGDTFTYKVTDEAGLSDTGTIRIVDQTPDFTISAFNGSNGANGDVLDLSGILSGATYDTLGSFVRMSIVAGNLVVKVDRDGAGIQEGFITLATIRGSDLTDGIRIKFGAGAAQHYGTLVADPLILDLDGNGFSFSTVGGGIIFDLDGDGQKDRLAWNTSNDGVLAYDLNGNGVIDDGSELFTPWFSGGNFANGSAALASLDSNGDGVIDANDEAFHKLSIWQDLNGDGVSDAGELKSLAEHGIVSLSASAQTTGGVIDGQTIVGEGSFTRADGSTGSYVEVELDVVPGGGEGPVQGETIIGTDGDDFLTGTDGDDIIIGGLGNDTLVGGAGADTFVFAEKGADNFDTIKDYVFEEGDAIDLSALLDGALVAENGIESQLSVTTADTGVEISIGGEMVAVLENHSDLSQIKILVDGEDYKIDL